MSKILDYLSEKLIPEQVSANANELEFFFTHFKPSSDDDRLLVQGIKQRLDNFSLAGLFLGLSLAVSLRRYTMPSEGFPFNKLLAGIALPTIGFGFCVKKGSQQALTELQPLRKALLEKEEEQYFEHLRQKSLKFPRIYRNVYSLVDEILSPEEFEKLGESSKKTLAGFLLSQDASYLQF